MRELGIWLRRGCDGRPAPVAAALAHLELVGIHPFYDGNGRTARALARLLLLRDGYALGGLVSLDAYLDNDRRAYFEAIGASAGRSYKPPYDATAFVQYFIGSIVGAADFVLARIKGLTLTLALLRRDVMSGRIPARSQDRLVYAWITDRSGRPTTCASLAGRARARRATSPQPSPPDTSSRPARPRDRRYRLGPRLAEVGPVPVI